MNPDVFAILATSAVKAIVGTTKPRIYRQGMAPQSTPGPYVTWLVLDGLPENALDELPRVDRVDIQVDAFSANDNANDEQQLEDLATALRDAIEAEHYVTQFADGGQDPATQRFRKMLRFTVWNSR